MASFEKKLKKSYRDWLFCLCFYANTGDDSTLEDTQKLIQDSVDRMVRTAIKLIGKKKGPQ
jgi:hypothetical protein